MHIDGTYVHKYMSSCECKKTVSDFFDEIDIFSFSARGGNYARFKPVSRFQNKLITFLLIKLMT